MIAVVGRILGVPVRDGGAAGLAAQIAVAAAARGAPVELVGKLGDDPAGDATLFALTRAGVGHAAILRDAVRPTPIVDRVGGSGTAGGVAAIAGAAGAGSAGDGDVAGTADDNEWLADLDGSAADAAAADAATERFVEPAGLGLGPGDLELALRYLTDVHVIVLADPASPELVPVAADGAGFAGAALVILGDPETLLADGAPQDATILSVPPGDPNGVFADLVAEYAVALDAGKPAAEAWAAATGRLGAERT